MKVTRCEILEDFRIFQSVFFLMIYGKNNSHHRRHRTSSLKKVLIDPTTSNLRYYRTERVTTKRLGSIR